MLRHGYVGTEHLLLALLRLPEESVVGPVLAGLGVSLDGARERLKALVPEGEHASPGQLPFTPRSKKTLVLSLREALGRDDDHIGPEHILLGIVAGGDEESLGVRLLEAMSVRPDQLYAAVHRALPPQSAIR